MRATCYPATRHTEGFMQTKASLSSERWNPGVGALGVGGLLSKGQGPCRFAFKIPGRCCPAPGRLATAARCRCRCLGP